MKKELRRPISGSELWTFMKSVIFQIQCTETMRALSRCVEFISSYTGHPFATVVFIVTWAKLPHRAVIDEAVWPTVQSRLRARANIKNITLTNTTSFFSSAETTGSFRRHLNRGFITATRICEKTTGVNVFSGTRENEWRGKLCMRFNNSQSYNDTAPQITSQHT